MSFVAMYKTESTAFTWSTNCRWLSLNVFILTVYLFLSIIWHGAHVMNTGHIAREKNSKKEFLLPIWMRLYWTELSYGNMTIMCTGGNLVVPIWGIRMILESIGPRRFVANLRSQPSKWSLKMLLYCIVREYNRKSLRTLIQHQWEQIQKRKIEACHCHGDDDANKYSQDVLVPPIVYIYMNAYCPKECR